MKVVETSLPGVLIVEPTVYADERGFFFESYNAKEMHACGIKADFVQDNHSRSVKNVLRGLHYQLHEPQAKLVRVVRGAAFDVAVDLRRHSPTFGKWAGTILSEENKRMLWIPEGFAHGFLVLSDHVDFLYKASKLYRPDADRVLAWHDPDIGIEWPLSEPPIVSMKDRNAPLLRDAEVFD
jgi:dTDP-4-dehydrorhamnose 3,5-epimerase